MYQFSSNALFLELGAGNTNRGFQFALIFQFSQILTHISAIMSHYH